MTRVSNIKKITKLKNLLHSEVECRYCMFQNSGKNFFQINTYKIGDTDIKEQSTQKIQFDREFAIKLINLLKKEFNL